MYIYCSHMGGLYTSTRALNFSELYCETCNDSDTYVGFACCREEAREVINSDRWASMCDKEYIEEFITENWED